MSKQNSERRMKELEKRLDDLEDLLRNVTENQMERIAPMVQRLANAVSELQTQSQIGLPKSGIIVP